MAGLIQAITGSSNPNPELNVLILSRADNPEVTNNVTQTINTGNPNQSFASGKFVQFYDFNIRPKGGNKLVVTDILDANEPNIERVSKKITEVSIDVVFDPNYYNMITTGQGLQAGNQLQALTITNNFFSAMDTLLINPQGFFIVNVINPQLNASRINQLVLNDYEWSPRSGSFIIDFKFSFYNVQTNKGQTQNIL